MSSGGGGGENGTHGFEFDQNNENKKTRKETKAWLKSPCDTIGLTATSWNFSLCQRVEKVCADRQLSIIDSVDRGHKSAYVAVR